MRAGIVIGAVLFAGVSILTSACQSSRVVASSSAPTEAPSIESPDISAESPESGAGAAVRFATERFRIPGSTLSFEMITVPRSTYEIGSPDSEAGRSPDEGPQKTVTVDAFQIGQFEVSNDAYTIFRYVDRDSDSTAVEGVRFDVDAVARPSTPYEDPAHGMSGRGFPAVGMTQWGALHFAKWVSDKTGQFFRLPTEAEWESACRAGTADWSLDEEKEEIAWFKSNSDGVLQRMGTRSPDALGVYDLLGNAAEWTLDQYDANFYASLEGGALVNPWRQPERLHPRTVRGGAYDDDASALRCSARKESDLVWKRRDPQIPKSFWWNTDAPFVGFRLVRPINQPTKEEQNEFWFLVLGE